jgi:hypothetical protein
LLDILQASKRTCCCCCCCCTATRFLLHPARQRLLQPLNMLLLLPSRHRTAVCIKLLRQTRCSLGRQRYNARVICYMTV